MLSCLHKCPFDDRVHRAEGRMILSHIKWLPGRKAGFMNRTRICVLLGDATGIGAEIVVRAFTDGQLMQRTDTAVVLLGDEQILKRAEQIVGETLSCRKICKKEIAACEDPLMLLDTGVMKRASRETGSEDPGVNAPFGKVSRLCGQAVIEDIYAAVGLYAEGLVSGICFAPFNKQAMRLADPTVASEMNVFQRAFESAGILVKGPVGEMNVVDNLWTTRVTSHVPLTRLSQYLTREGILQMIRMADRQLKMAGIDHPGIMVAALNPHCGEGGLCGDEEQTMILPAIDDARKEGIRVLGMYSADTVFVHAFAGEADAVVTMYHDQGQIALKLKSFAHAVTIAAGFPAPIGTPAHGTAHDIAGKGKASCSAFMDAFTIISRQARNSSAEKRKGQCSSFT